jgi:hypothetical protein
MAKRYRSQHRRGARHNVVWQMRDDVFVSRHFGLTLVYLIPSLILALITLIFSLLKFFYNLARLAFLDIRGVIEGTPQSR